MKNRIKSSQQRRSDPEGMDINSQLFQNHGYENVACLAVDTDQGGCPYPCYTMLLMRQRGNSGQRERIRRPAACRIRTCGQRKRLSAVSIKRHIECRYWTQAAKPCSLKVLCGVSNGFSAPCLLQITLERLGFCRSLYSRSN